MHKAHSSEFIHTLDVSSAELVTGKADMAIKATNEFFNCFKWNPGIELLRDIQAGVLNREQVRGSFVIR